MVMRERSTARTAVTALATAIGLVGLASCNQILGFEVGELGTTSGATDATSSGNTGGAANTTVSTTTTTTTDASSSTSASGTGGTGGGPPVIPLNGLLLWFDGDKGITTNANSVTGWADQSPNHNDATQVVPANAPTVSAIGSHPAISFSGTGQFLDLPDISTDLSTGVTVFAVIIDEDTNRQCPPIVQFSNGDEQEDIDVHVEPGGSLYYEVSDQWFYTAPLFPALTPTLLTVRHDASSNVTLNVNGVQQGQKAVNLPGNTTRTENFIGKGLYPSCELWRGKIGELIYYSRPLTIAETASVEGYLQTKWACCGM